MKLHAVIIIIYFIRIKLIAASDVNISALCKAHDKKCIWKCCPIGQHVRRKICVPSNMENKMDNRLNIAVYDEQLNQSEKNLEDVFDLIPDIMSNMNFRINSFNISMFGNLYLKEDGNLYLEFPNAYDRWLHIKTDHFCVDTKVKYGKEEPVILAVLEEKNNNNYYDPMFKYALIVSMACLLLTSLPYAIFSRLRDMNGVILIVFIAFFTSLTSIELCMISSSFNKLEAMVMAIFYYFCILSSFCWTNVMFYRIRWSREVPEPIQMKKLLLYLLYAVGLPLVLTFLMTIIEMSQPTLAKQMPWFVTPQLIDMGNFNFKGKESVLYLHIPLLLLLSFNWFVSIAYIREERRPHSASAPLKKNKHLESILNRPMRYVALLVILTIYCIVQIISIFCENATGIMIVMDSSTICLGPLVFIIFIHKDVLKIAKDCCTKQDTDNFSIVYKEDNNDTL